jgi:hypothetical protein
MRRALTKLAATLTLSQVCPLYGSPLLLAYQEQALAPESSCPRSCCHLAKTGSSSYASACCAVRCKEPQGDRGSEPARTRLALGALQALPVAAASAGPLTDGLSDRRPPSETDCHPSADGQPGLNVRHSVFLV